jgi:hypothetical protein
MSEVVKYENGRSSGTNGNTEWRNDGYGNGGVLGGVKDVASAYVLCPHLTDGFAFQFTEGT